MPATFRVEPPSTPDHFRTCYRLRWQLLRAPWGQPPGSEQDGYETVAWHRMAVNAQGEIIGYGRLHREAKDLGRIRYMFVVPQWRGRGVGAALLESLEDVACEQGMTGIRLDARAPVLGFYLRHGYRDLGPGPLLFGVIAHRRMEKRLDRECERRRPAPD